MSKRKNRKPSGPIKLTDGRFTHGLTGTKTFKAYWNHKEAAKRRGIKFLFAFDEWITWWAKELGPDWLKLRGTSKDQFCMARNGDKGPYAPWNVKCKTNHENLVERSDNGISFKGNCNGNAKLREVEVIKIFYEKGTISALSRKYGVARGSIRGIKDRRYWGHITKGLIR